MNSKRKTLIILTPGFAKDEADSVCLPMQQSLLLSIKEQDPDLDIIILSFQYPYHTEKYTWMGMTVVPFSGRNKGGLKRLLLRKKIMAELEELHSTNKIDGLLSFWNGECAWIGKKFGDKHSIRHYCWILGQDAKKGNKYPRRTRLKAGDLIALSDFVQEEFERNHGVRPQYIIPPGIDKKQFAVPLPVKDIDITAAGSLIPLKQYDIFLQVIAEVKKIIPGIKAVLIGDGPEKKDLEELSTQLGLVSSITFTGELPHPVVLQWMQRTKVFLHTSSYEAFGVVCIEALQAGATVVSFVKPMNKNIPHWYHPYSKEEMIQKTIEILQNPPAVYEPVTVFTIDGTAQQLLGSFSF